MEKIIVHRLKIVKENMLKKGVMAKDKRNLNSNFYESTPNISVQK